MSESSPIRVGLLGHGLAGGVLHAPLIEAAGDFRITAVASTRDLSSRRDGPRASDVDGVIGAADVDLVVVVTPNEGHFPYARAALEAGKHVVIDKPFALSTGEADTLIDLADAKGLVLTAFHNRRADGDYLAVREAMASGSLGKVLLFHGQWDRFRPVVPEGWRNSTAAGGGLLWDLGPHLIDQALQLFGPPDSLVADIATQRDGALADDYFELILRYGEMRCVLAAASVLAEPRPRFGVHGTTGSFLTFGVDPFEAALRAGEHPSDAGFQDRLPPIPGRRVTADGSEEVAIPAGSWVGFYRQLARAIRGEGPAPVPAREARAVIALIEQARAQAN